MFKKIVPLSMALFFTSEISAANMDGLYYCTGQAAAGVEHGVGKSFAPFDKFTAKVSSQAGSVILSGDANFSFDLIGNNRENQWVYATGGAYYIFTMYGNKRGAFNYTLNLSRTNSETFDLEALFVEMGTCQSW